MANKKADKLKRANRLRTFQAQERARKKRDLEKIRLKYQVVEDNLLTNTEPRR